MCSATASQSHCHSGCAPASDVVAQDVSLFEHIGTMRCAAPLPRNWHMAVVPPQQLNTPDNWCVHEFKTIRHVLHWAQWKSAMRSMTASQLYVKCRFQQVGNSNMAEFRRRQLCVSTLL